VTVDRDEAGQPWLSGHCIVLSDVQNDVVCLVPLEDNNAPDFSATDLESIAHADGLAKQLTAWPAVVAALQVLVLDRRTRAYLTANDPKALGMATRALDAAGLQSAPIDMALAAEAERTDEANPHPWVKFPFTPDVAATINGRWWLDDAVGTGPYEWKDQDGETWVRLAPEA
jgi:hypothetical protein